MAARLGKGSARRPRTQQAMRARIGIRGRRLVAACVAVAALCVAAAPALAQTIAADAVVPRPQALGTFQITYYWFAPERWFTARKMIAPGLGKAYREDFLYSARGVAMQGTGTGDDDVLIHWRSGAGAWVNAEGQPTHTSAGGFTNGSPYARPGGCVWWRINPTTKEIAPRTTDNLRPSFPNPDGTWQNRPASPGDYRIVCDRAAAKAYRYSAGKPFKDNRAKRNYPDEFGVGVGTPVVPWHSIATDTDVIPSGTRIYIEALKDTPSKGCFSADDTGGAIIGKHIDVLIPPDKSLSLPGHGDLVAVPDGVSCPVPKALPAGPLGTIKLAYLVPAAERAGTSRTVLAPGMRYRAMREDFLFGTDGVVARLVGITVGGRTVQALGGGWWVNAAGKRTTRLADGTWSAGDPVWRDGGWRTKRGRPTFQRADGTWSAGVGVRRLRYHDRFSYASAGRYVPWKTIVSRRQIAPIGTLLKIGGVARASCMLVTGVNPLLPRGTIQLVVPPGTDPSTLPATAPVTVLRPRAGTATGCPAT